MKYSPFRSISILLPGAIIVLAGNALEGRARAQEPEQRPVYKIGGGVSAPVPIYKPAPADTEEARRAYFQGTAVLFLVVDENGDPRDIRVIRSGLPVLDRVAVETLSKWKFRPGMKDGKPVAVQAMIEVNFRPPEYLWPGSKPAGWSIIGANFSPSRSTPPALVVDPPAGGLSKVLIPLDPTLLDPKVKQAPQGMELLLSLAVDENGDPKDVRMIQPVDPDVDRKAVETVSKCKFRPGTRDGNPVRAQGIVEVYFQPAFGSVQASWRVIHSDFSRIDIPVLVNAPSGGFPDLQRPTLMHADFDIDAQGTTHSVVVVADPAENTDAVAAALGRWTFTPAKQGGVVPIAVHAKLEFRYEGPPAPVPGR